MESQWSKKLHKMRTLCFCGRLPFFISSAIRWFHCSFCRYRIKFLFFASLSAFLWGCGAIVFFILNFFSNDRPNDALRRGFFVALLCLVLFWWKLGRRNGHTTAFLVLALAFCCLWDDLLSKRWIWVGAALLAARPAAQRNA